MGYAITIGIIIGILIAVGILERQHPVRFLIYTFGYVLIFIGWIPIDNAIKNHFVSLSPWFFIGIVVLLGGIAILFVSSGWREGPKTWLPPHTERHELGHGGSKSDDSFVSRNESPELVSAPSESTWVDKGYVNLFVDGHWQKERKFSWQLWKKHLLILILLFIPVIAYVIWSSLFYKGHLFGL